MFVDMHEDELLRDSVKWSAYAGKRVIEWDNSDVKVCVYENPLYQRNTYSKYDGGNCAKGAVFLQPCGWIGTTELWTGHISDTEYMERNKIFQLQEEYVQSCQDPRIPFTNILDRGYRVALSAWKTGKQTIIQPAFVKADKKFSSKKVLYSATVATDRSGNERAVNVCTRSLRIRRGLGKLENPKNMSDLWLTWSFQCNFMFKSVV